MASSIIGDKLSGITKNVTTITDYSLPKINKDVVSTKAYDPYHEPIE